MVTMPPCHFIAGLDVEDLPLEGDILPTCLIFFAHRILIVSLIIITAIIIVIVLLILHISVRCFAS